MRSLVVRLMLVCGLVSAAWSRVEAAASLRKPITIDQTRISGSADLSQFPVLISLQNDSDLMAGVASPAGGDIQFRAADGVTILDHEIESYDPATGTLVAWVRVPHLRFDADTTLYIYYGDASVACSLENPSGVWNSGYLGVWHLQQDPSVAAPQIYDSTFFANHGTSGGAMTSTDQVAGKIGGALDFDGVDDSVDTGSAPILADLGPLTFSAWIRPASAGGSSAGKIASKYGATSGRWYVEIDATAPETNAIDVSKNTSSGDVSHVSVDNTVSFGTWQYVVVTWDGSTNGAGIHIYKDGVETAYQASLDGSLPLPSDASYPFILGNRVSGTTGFHGLLDESRLSRVVRSPDWIRTEFNNQNQPTKNAGCSDTGFACVGAQEVLPGTFTNVSAGSGLDTPGAKDGGVSWADFNDDGCLDLLVNTNDKTQGSHLYMQDVSGGCSSTFTDVTACLAPGLAANALERSAIWGDLNNDGYPDFARDTSGSIEVYLNNGPGSSGCGVAWTVFGTAGSPSQTFATGSVPFKFNAEGLGFMDYDADGDLDLMSDQAGAIAIFDNVGGTLGYVATPNLPSSAAGNSDYTAVTDMDVDGDVDILDRRGSSPDLFLNDANGGTFTAGTFDESASNGNKGGVAFCDFDDDGDFDLFWTDAPTSQIWEQTGVGSATFVARGLPAGIVGNIDGVACADVDNDGDLDLMLTSDGNDQLFRNDGGFSFTDISPASFGVDDGEGTAFADYDRDGDVDLVINQGTANELWRNETNNNNYLVVRALHDLGGGIARDALGATLRLLDCSLSAVSGVREVNGGRGHGSQDPAYVHMGLPTCTAPHGPNSRYVVEVQFVGGAVVRKAVVPSQLGSYQLLEVRDTDSDDLTACTTAVELTTFQAEGADGAVVLTWETGSEVDNLGFRLYRALGANGPFDPLSSLVPGLGSSPAGARYRYIDGGLSNGTTYYYELEDIETSGRTKRHGPVAASPEPGIDAGSIGEIPPPEVEDAGALPARMAYGEPEASEIRVRPRGAKDVLLELETPGFYAFPLDDGSVRLEIPGFIASEDSALPVRRVWLPAPEGDVEIVSVRASGVESFSGLRPAEADETDVVMDREGTVRLRRRSRTRSTSQEAGRDRSSDFARLLGTALQGPTRKVQIELSPLQWDGPGGRLLLARRLEVHLRFRGKGRTVSEELIGSAGRRLGSIAFDLATVRRGLYRVKFEDLFFGPRRPLRASELRLSRQGVTVPFHIEPDGRRFGPGSSLYFVSAGADANPYGNEAVYRLESGVSGTEMTEALAAPRGARVSFYRQQVQREENHFYQAALVDASDPWFWDLVMGGSSKTIPLDLEGLVAEEPARLSVSLQGGSDEPAALDHHVRLWWNGALVGEDSWNAKRPRRLDVDVPPSELKEGENLLRVENVGDTGASFSMVFLDRLSLDYPHRLEAPAEGPFEGTFAAAGEASVAGLSAGTVLLDVTGNEPRWLEDGLVAPDGTFRFAVEANRRYLAVDPRAVRKPLVRAVPLPTLSDDSRQADYIVIAPREFLDAMEPLTARRESQGLQVASVSLEEITSEFGYGERTPEAIHSFLSYAYHRWQAPAPRYVLLVGDGTYDFKDALGLGSEHNRLPPMMIRTRFLWTASDPTYAAVNGDDPLPDLAIGRLPAASVDELSAMVTKILTFENAGTGDSGRVILVADNSDAAGDFEADAEALARTVLAGRDLTRIYLRQLGTAETRARILAGFDDGSSIMSYVGHGGIDLWASERLLRSSDVSLMGPQPRQPILLTMNCLNGYFHFPFFDSLSEALLKAPNRGVIAAFSPSGLSLHRAAHLFQTTLLHELTPGAHRRLGDAVLAAQDAFIDAGGLTELVSIYQLLGDPGLVIETR